MARHEAQVPADQQGQRLDRFLADAGAMSRGAARRLIEAGCVQIDDKRIRTQAHPVEAGTTLRWSDPVASEAPTPLDVVHEDDALWILCKPAGLDTVPPAQGGPSLLDLVRERLRQQGRPQVAESHRLDRETSGLLVFGRDVATVSWLGRALQRRQIGRGYVALIRSLRPPQAMRIEAPLRPAARGGMEIHPTGAYAATRVAPLAFAPEAGLALVGVTLETGRTHQARVHLSWALGPIVGDTRYGDDRAARGSDGDAPAGNARIGLHSGRVGLRHPVDGKPRSWARAPDDGFFALAAGAPALPPRWADALRELGRGDFEPDRALVALRGETSDAAAIEGLPTRRP